MEIDSSNGASGANAIGGQGVGGADTDLDRDAFMRLLVTQIRNQDPMDPMDTREMMTQLTQLTSVEHLIGIEDRLATLQVGTASIANSQVAGFVGKTVMADTSNLRVEEAGPIPGAFELEGRAEEVMVTIRDAEGRVVRTMELGPQAPGSRTYEWDGMNDSGERVAEGRYRVEISATSESGAPVTAHTQVRGTVTGVSYEDGYPELILDGEYRVLMGDVREVSGEEPTASTSSDEPMPDEPTPTSLGTPTVAIPDINATSPETAIASYEGSR